MNTQFIDKTIRLVAPLGTMSSFLLGSGLCYSIQTKKYWDIPVVLLCPVAYSGYQVYTHKDTILYDMYVVLLSKKLK